MTVEWSPAALRDVGRLDRDALRRIRRAVHRFADDGIGDVAKLRGREDAWRLRVGDWRVIFHRLDGGIVVERVYPRRNAYR
jgi:mRNA interferase RelE/StbE